MDVTELSRVRALVPQPILRKDFIFDPYQVWQARAYGADAILLMANLVTREGLRELSQLAESLGMHVLFETHEASEIQELPAGAKICGINSRRFMAGQGKRAAYWVSSMLSKIGVRWDSSIDPKHFELAHALPAGCVKVAESGVDPSMIGQLRGDFNAVLVGTSILMSKRGVPSALQEFEKAIMSPHLALPGGLDRNGFQRAAA
jgi:indole-3-glycerol phosphate synthase